MQYQTIHRGRGLLLWIGFLSLIFFSPTYVSAARLSFEAPTMPVGVGQQLQVLVRLSTEGEVINAVSGSIFVPDFLHIDSVELGRSIVPFWVKEPDKSRGQIVFEGVIPGGWRGNEGDLFSLTITTIESGKKEITFGNTDILLHDGKGTPIQVTSIPLLVAVEEDIPVTSFTTLNENDQELPEAFIPLLGSDPELFGGRYFLAFSAQDKGSGIDHYEVQERESKLEGTDGVWEVVASPYVLKDQSLRSLVYIRAVDRSENVRLVLWQKDRSSSTWAISILAVLGVFSLLLGFLVYTQKLLKN